ncbi:hypothetical protein [Shewanella marina]|uniref:hypothetical protein n=1 Tax=Shewanella marina TaxID=487319 RepID=UPI0011DD8108|nr:hypothetical protein [Shewanella marina]
MPKSTATLSKDQFDDFSHWELPDVSADLPKMNSDMFGHKVQRDDDDGSGKTISFYHQLYLKLKIFEH